MIFLNILGVKCNYYHKTLLKLSGVILLLYYIICQIHYEYIIHLYTLTLHYTESCLNSED